MRRIRRVFALALGILVAGAVVADIQVEADASVDFAGYGSYAWANGTPARRDVAEQRIRRAVDLELAEAGFRLVEAEDAELWVVTHALIDRHSLEDLRKRDYWDFFTGARSTDPFELGAGTLVVDLIDKEQERVVWRGRRGDSWRLEIESEEARQGDPEAVQALASTVTSRFG